MDRRPTFKPEHPRYTRRSALQAGAIGVLGLGMNHVEGLRALAGEDRSARAKSVIYIFLSGGLSQIDSFDLKPDASEEIRGEFRPIATRTPGIHICEHLPRLAARSHLWALVRSLTHRYNEHSQGHLAMLTGQTPLPAGFNPEFPKPSDWPSIAAIAGQVTAARNNLPPAVILPEQLIHRTGRIIPGQFAGPMGSRYEPHFISASPFNASTYGAYPEYGFHHARGAENPPGLAFQAPSLSLPEGLGQGRLSRRFDLLKLVEGQQRRLDRLAEVESFDRFREKAISLLVDGKLKQAFDVVGADPKVLDRYGRNTFGWSLLMARRLVEAGVNLVQVNLGNNETWDTHESAFPNLKNFLFPPTDLALSALLDDLEQTGLAESTLVVMAGEFGRTPKISTLPGATLPGRDHWGTVQSVLLAGGGVRGGTVVGATDATGGYPIKDPQQPENLAATIYQALGLPRSAAWRDLADRPHPVYHGQPIRGLV